MAVPYTTADDTRVPDYPPSPPLAPPLEPPVAPPWGGWQPPPLPPLGGRPEPSRSRPVLSGIAVFVAAMLVSLVLGLFVGSKLHHSSSPASPTALTQSPTSPAGGGQALPTPRAPAGGGALSADQIAAAVDPAIVDINTTLANGEAAGSGMVLTSDGLVLTNNHVIADATDIRVQVTTSGATYRAEVLGYDTTADVALLRLVGASGLKTVSVARASSVRLGDTVVALGNALGQGGIPAVAEGRVTGLDRSITVSDETGRNTETLSGLIEIDARLLPGDSGGPLVNQAGQVIGMDTAASASYRRQFADGYAIPIDTALALAHQIQAGKSSALVHIGDRALLGVAVEDGTDNAVIAGVEPGSPAESIGLSVGDTVVAVGNTRVTDGASLRSALDPYHPGDRVSLSWVDTAGQRHTANPSLVKGPPA